MRDLEAEEEVKRNVEAVFEGEELEVPQLKREEARYPKTHPNYREESDEFLSF